VKCHAHHPPSAPGTRHPQFGALHARNGIAIPRERADWVLETGGWADRIRELTEREGDPIVVKEELGTPGQWMNERLEALGVDTAGLAVQTIHVVDAPHVAILFTFRPDGRIVAIHGNGIWLQDESLRSFRALPELRVIGMDHNGYLANHPRVDYYSARGFDVLHDSQIGDVAITLGPSNAGLAEIVQLQNLRRLRIFHSRITDEGMELLRNHPTLVDLVVGEMGKVTAPSLEIIATIPNLRSLAFTEAYVPYEGGLAYLAPLSGQLEKIDLRMSLVSDADLARLASDHPNAEILTSTPEQIARGHIGVARTLVQQGPEGLTGPLKAAIDLVTAEQQQRQQP